MRWEYRLKSIEMMPIQEGTRELNELGEQGWELVTIIILPTTKGDVVFYKAVFKRPISN